MRGPGRWVLAGGLWAGAATVLAAPAAQGPQGRGPAGRVISSETWLHLECSDTRNVRWKTALPGRGHSSPVVWGNRIFLTTAVEGPLVPGAKAVTHYNGGREYLHPDAVGA